MRWPKLISAACSSLSWKDFAGGNHHMKRDSERSGPSGLIWKISSQSGMKLIVVSGKTQWK